MFHSWKEWLGAQQVVTVKKLYRDPIQLNWGKPCIWLSNRDPREELMDKVGNHTSRGQVEGIDNDIEWLDANCIFVHLTEAIFHASTESPRE